MDRVLRSADFQRVLQAPQKARSAHFALHFVADSPSRTGPPRPPASTQLSTEASFNGAQAVDNEPDRCWFGLVVPKRHARRAVTRTLLKRQIREAGRRYGEGLAHGLWVVRLRMPFDRQQYPSAASDALRKAARCELDGLFQRVSQSARKAV